MTVTIELKDRMVTFETDKSYNEILKAIDEDETLKDYIGLKIEKPKIKVRKTNE